MSLKPMQAALMINKLLETWPITDVAKLLDKSVKGETNVSETK